MLQLLQEGVRAPEELVDLNELPLADIEVSGDGIRIGALARMAEVADNRDVQESFPVVVQALLATSVQYGHDRRQSLAADPVSLLSRRRDSLQQA